MRILFSLIAFFMLTGVAVADEPYACENPTQESMPDTSEEPFILIGDITSPNVLCDCSVNYETIYYDRTEQCFVNGMAGTRTCVEKWKRTYYTTPWYCPEALYPCPASELKLVEKVCGQCNQDVGTLIDNLLDFFFD